MTHKPTRRQSRKTYLAGYPAASPDRVEAVRTSLRSASEGLLGDAPPLAKSEIRTTMREAAKKLFAHTTRKER